jgi:hypothetical protein
MSRVIRFDSNGEAFLGDPPTNVISFHPPKSELILLYEVVDEGGNAEWGGNSEREALAWIASSPTATRILVSGWESDEDDAQLIGQPLDITTIVREASR